MLESVVEECRKATTADGGDFTAAWAAVDKFAIYAIHNFDEMGRERALRVVGAAADFLDFFGK